MRILCAAIALSALTACPEPDDSPDSGCFIGDAGAAPEIVIVHRTIAGLVETTSASVPLIQPPQGGKVLLVGVRARNLDGCPLVVTASLRDPCTNRLISLERRPVLLEPTSDGWAEPKNPIEISNFSNLPACPRTSLVRNVDGEPYLLTIAVEDGAGRKTEAARTIVPFCAEAEHTDLCLCECQTGYVLGQSCAGMRPDAGLPAGTCPDGGG